MKWRIIEIIGTNIPTFKLQTRSSGIIGKLIGWRTEKEINYSKLGGSDYDKLFSSKEEAKQYLERNYNQYEITVEYGEL